jgi:hypothetical protein
LDDLVLGDTFTEFLTLPAARLLGNDGDDPPSGAFG